MRIIKVFVLILGVSFFTMACGSGTSGGGGSGGASADNSQPQAVGLKTDTITNFQQGDNWHYSVAATYSDAGGSESFSGTAATDILSTTKQSPVTPDDCLDQRTLLDVSGAGGNMLITSHSYFLQDATGSLFAYGHGDSITDVWVDSPGQGFYLSLQSPVSVGQNSTESGSYTNGDTWTYTYSVTAVENVSTGAGLYEAYRVESRAVTNYTNGNMVVVNDTTWYVPGIGAIKMTISEELSTAGVQQSLLTYTATLTGTNLTY